MNTPKVSIIVPVFNCWNLTEQCLDAIPATTKDVPYEVIIVDNASTDDTWRNLCLRTDDLQRHRRDVNENFSGACNYGNRVARGEYLCFLNNDTIPFDGWLSAMVDELEKNPNTAIVGSRLCYPDGTIQHAGVAFMRESKFPYHPYRGLSAELPCVDRRKSLQCITGASMLVRRDVFDECGGFNPKFINGGEDVDFCLRAKRIFHRDVVYEPKSTLIHLESQSPGRMLANEENCKLFFELWGDALLADEDAFYFEDGLHRVGSRKSIAGTVLRPLEAPGSNEYQKERHQWHTVAYAQAQCVNQDLGKLDSVLSFYQDWPEDASVRDWAAELSASRELYRVACGHYAAARDLRRKEEGERITQEIQALEASKIYPLKCGNTTS